MHFSAAKAKAFRVSQIGDKQQKTSAGEDERNVRIFQHPHSILNNKPFQLLADLHWLQPNQGSTSQPTLYWKWSPCFGIWWSISHYSSNAWRNAFWQFVEILAADHSVKKWCQQCRVGPYQMESSSWSTNIGKYVNFLSLDAQLY